MSDKKREREEGEPNATEPETKKQKVEDAPVAKEEPKEVAPATETPVPTTTATETTTPAAAEAPEPAAAPEPVEPVEQTPPLREEGKGKLFEFCNSAMAQTLEEMNAFSMHLRLKYLVDTFPSHASDLKKIKYGDLVNFSEYRGSGLYIADNDGADGIFLNKTRGEHGYFVPEELEHIPRDYFPVIAALSKGWDMIDNEDIDQDNLEIEMIDPGFFKPPRKSRKKVRVDEDWEPGDAMEEDLDEDFEDLDAVDEYNDLPLEEEEEFSE